MVMNDYKESAVLVLSGKVGGMDVGGNPDYNKIWHCTAPCEENPCGIAVYVTPNFDNMSYPIRLEYLNDGSGAYLPRTGIDSRRTSRHRGRPA
jgi:hypothetical protein